MGFRTRLRLLSPDIESGQFCSIPRARVQVCPSYGFLRDFADPQTLLDPTFNGDEILPRGNANWSQLDVPAIDREMDQAKLLTSPEQRARAWARANRDIVAQAPVILYSWGYQPAMSSANVRGVQNRATASWDLSFTSLR
jgi:peptide/nickel transport system substrate-binding protein